MKSKIISLILIVFIAGCAAGPTVRVQKEYDYSKNLTCAVLPFYYAKANDKETAVMLRDIFTADLQSSDLKIRKNSTTDRELSKRGMGLKQYDTEELVEIGETLGVDLVIFGVLTKRTKLYALVHSNVTVGARIMLVDVNKREVMFDIEKEETRNAGLLRVPTGFVAAAVAPLKGLDDYYVRKITFDLAKNLAEPISEAFSGKAQSSDAVPPYIDDVFVKFVPKAPRGGNILVAVLGEKGCSAHIENSELAGKYTLSSSGSGLYIGDFSFPESVELLRDMKVVLTADSGAKSTRSINITYDSDNTSETE